MSDLASQTPANTYKGLLQVNDYTNGVDATAKYVQDGEGTDSALAISTTKVGIGTASPSDKIEIISNSPQFGATITNTTANPARLTLANTEGSANIDCNNNLLVLTNNTASDLVIDSNGKVGIGTASPSARLDVNASENSNYAAKIFNNGGDSYGLLVKTSSGITEAFPLLDLENVNSNVFRVQADGKVGIGTASPSAKLAVETDAGTYSLNTNDFSQVGLLIKSNTTEGSGNKGGSVAFTALTGAGGKHAAITAVQTDVDSNNVGLAFEVHQGGTSGDPLIEAMRIDRNGKVGIGTTSPTAPLEVASTTGGMIMPRMTTTQMIDISSPTDGEMIYNTTANKFYGRAGGSWVALH